MNLAETDHWMLVKRLRRAWLAACLTLLPALLACQAMPRANQTAPTYALAAVPDGAVGRLAGTYLNEAGPRDSTWLLLANSQEAFDARYFLIESAINSIDLQYYIFRPDGSGSALLQALQRAAKRGVRVRMLLDDWGARPDYATLRRLSSTPGFNIRVFNPLDIPSLPLLSLMLDFSQAQRRMHNKLIVVDNAAAIVGGRNVGDEYFQQRREFAFADVDLLLFGPVVPQLSSGFDLYWNDPSSAIIEADPSRSSSDENATAELSGRAMRTPFAERILAGQLKPFSGPATAVQDQPGKVDPSRASEQSVLGHDIASLMGNVRSELLIVSPYFVPGVGGVDQLRALTSRGVQVTVVTNSLVATDVPAVHAGYARYRTDLLKAGVKLFELRADASGRHPRQDRAGSSRVSLHAKVMVVDQEHAFIGSMNIDPRSLRLNTENGVVIHDARMSSELVRGVERDLPADAWSLGLDGNTLTWTGQEDGKTVTWTTEPKASLFLRLKNRLMSWLPIENLL